MRPVMLTKGPHTGVYRHGVDIRARSLISTISRADVAEFMLNQLSDRIYAEGCCDHALIVRSVHVCFGSLATIAPSLDNVRFALVSRRRSWQRAEAPPVYLGMSAVAGAGGGN